MKLISLNKLKFVTTICNSLIIFPLIGGASCTKNNQDKAAQNTQSNDSPKNQSIDDSNDASLNLFTSVLVDDLVENHPKSQELKTTLNTHIENFHSQPHAQPPSAADVKNVKLQTYLEFIFPEAKLTAALEKEPTHVRQQVAKAGTKLSDRVLAYLTIKMSESGDNLQKIWQKDPANIKRGARFKDTGFPSFSTAEEAQANISTRLGNLKASGKPSAFPFERKFANKAEWDKFVASDLLGFEPLPEFSATELDKTITIKNLPVYLPFKTKAGAWGIKENILPEGRSNSDFGPSNKAENNAAAAQAILTITPYINSDTHFTDLTLVKKISSEIHNAWLQRNQWAKGDKTYDVPFDQLDPEFHINKANANYFGPLQLADYNVLKAA